MWRRKKDKEKEEGGIKEFTAFFAVPGTEINDDNEIQEKNRRDYRGRNVKKPGLPDRQQKKQLEP